MSDSSELVHATTGRSACSPQNSTPLTFCGVALRRHGPGVHSPIRQLSTTPISRSEAVRSSPVFVGWSRAGLGAMMLCVPSLIPPAMAAGSLRRSPHPSVPVGAIAVLRPWLPSDADAAWTFSVIQKSNAGMRRADSVGRGAAVDHWLD